MSDDPLDRLCDLDNAIEAERVRRLWADRAPVLAWLMVMLAGCLCIICRGGSLY